MSEKIVKESEDFEGRDSGWTLNEILRLEVRTNRYSPFRGSSSFIEVPKQIAETKAIINVINKKDSQCFMWSILAALYPNTSNPNKTSCYVPHLNKLNFDGISFPTPLNEISLKTFGKYACKLINLTPVAVEKNNSTRPLSSKVKANAGEKQLNSSVGTKQLNSTGENNSTWQHERNNSTGENNSTQQQERTTQLGSRNETTQLASRNETQLVSRNETTQLCTTVDRLQPPTTACNRLQPPAPPLQQNRLFLPTCHSKRKCRILFVKIIL
ncbi:c2H2-type domain-containing protein [Trichonephila clavipes]|nr:c2H2-type domain-containing protein [Trichonephila clavipes]